MIFSLFMLPTLILLFLAISVISLRVIFHLPVQINEFIVIAEFYNGRSYTLVTDSQGAENISYGKHRHNIKAMQRRKQNQRRKNVRHEDILPRRATHYFVQVPEKSRS
jgi:hypothetical protein